MREIIAIDRSSKRARMRVETVLDRYFWRIGDQAWRGRASNACLDRVARELRKGATRNMAVTISEIRSARESRVPIIRIGNARAFSETGLVEVSSHPALARKGESRNTRERCLRGITRAAAIFHDVGKAGNMFQDKLTRALAGRKGEGDAIRHEVISAAVFDHLLGGLTDAELIAALPGLAPHSIDAAFAAVSAPLMALHAQENAPFEFEFLKPDAGKLVQSIGQLILSHHRLPDGSDTGLHALSKDHIHRKITLEMRDLNVAPGEPFWHEQWFAPELARAAGDLIALPDLAGVDIAARAALMLSDHLGSAMKEANGPVDGHLANTVPGETPNARPQQADSLSRHVRRVCHNVFYATDAIHRYRNRYPALTESGLPVEIAIPPVAAAPFSWQSQGAAAAGALAARGAGGFFGCLMAGTGTGKTRGAPTILAAATIRDALPERRGFRASLCLGLRSLATQSAREYIDDLGFRDEDVAVMVGQAPLDFPDPSEDSGSESLIEIPEWLHVARENGGIPDVGSPGEDSWLRSLSLDTGRDLPAFCKMILEKSGSRRGSGERLLSSPIMVGTIDHLMPIADPARSHWLIPALRLFTSDLILDEIDQFGPEDIAAIARLVFQAGAAGRRVIAMSATMTPVIAQTLHEAYCLGWTEFAAISGIEDRVRALCISEAEDSCATADAADGFATAFTRCREATLAHIRAGEPRRPGCILPQAASWEALVEQSDQVSRDMHKEHHTEIDGHKVSIGLLRMTRIAHCAAMARQLEARDDPAFILCLHSAFPRLDRAWLETRLKRALTRKGSDPDAGLRALCHAEDLFERAENREIRILVVSSPVIETGNDLDFDYAIVDPVSIRSIVQTAGRVRRHRRGAVTTANVAIMGMSPIVLQGGLLAMPGVETEPHSDTLLTWRRPLDALEGRNFINLSGDQSFARVDASPYLDPDPGCPLLAAELDLLTQMINTDPGAPLGAYLCTPRQRMTRAPARLRKFRRSTSGDLLYRKSLGDDGEISWVIDLDPGNWRHRPLAALDNGLQIDQETPRFSLVNSIAERAWFEFGAGREMNKREVKKLFEVKISDFKAGKGGVFPDLSYNEFTGFTRGVSEDLFEAFGKSQ